CAFFWRAPVVCLVFYLVRLYPWSSVCQSAAERRSVVLRARTFRLRRGSLGDSVERAKGDPGQSCFVRNSNEVGAVAAVICREDHEQALPALDADALTYERHIHGYVRCLTDGMGFPAGQSRLSSSRACSEHS